MQPIPLNGTDVPRRRVAEAELVSTAELANPFQDARLSATFFSPSGRQILRSGFWDGDDLWRVRFAPDEEGLWRYHLKLNDTDGTELAAESGSFTCVPALDETVFDRHGPVRLSDDKRCLIHSDGTPFFYLADTAWNGPLRSTPDEWDHYLAERVRQGFSAVQWVAAQWRAAPDGDIEGQTAFEGHERITVTPAFFQRLDRYLMATTQAGLLNVPVMLWAIGAGANPTIDPGYGLPEDQAILLARYMLARWGAYPVMWILAGDGKYEGEYAARWRRIGRAVFADHAGAPVAMHCGGQHWPADEFRGELWMNVLGYQSGHGDSDENWRWLLSGPPANQWDRTPRLFQINIEPPYENHVAYHSKKPHDAASVRRGLYWSLLNAPTAGVTYGGHGVWGWDDGTSDPVDHPGSGTPLPWREALTMPGAEQVAHVGDFFRSVAWWRLEPAPELLAVQPGAHRVAKHVLSARSQEGDLVVVYSPAGEELRLKLASIQPDYTATWCNPRTGERVAASSEHAGELTGFMPPDREDWLLILQAADGK